MEDKGLRVLAGVVLAILRYVRRVDGYACARSRNRVGCGEDAGLCAAPKTIIIVSETA